MILVDANLLLYAYNTSSPHHSASRRWLESIFQKPEPVRFAWVTILAFVRIGTNPRAYPHPFTVSEASAIVTSWLKQPSAGLLDPGERHWDILSELLESSQANGHLVTDAHLAALAIEHGALLYTTDKDFTRFTGLKFENPL